MQGQVDTTESESGSVSAMQACGLEQAEGEEMTYAIKWHRTEPDLPAKSGYRQVDGESKAAANPLLFSDLFDAKEHAAVLNEVGYGGYYYEAVEYK